MEEGPGLGDLVAGRTAKTGVRLDPSVAIIMPVEGNASLCATHFSLSFVIVSSYIS